MAGKPWEKYAATAPASAGKPWEKYGAPQEDSLLKKTGKTALDLGLRALDYGGGIVRTGVAGTTNLIPSMQGKVVTEDDLLAALKGKAPSSSEYMERAGIPEGKLLDLPIPFTNIQIPISARGAAGLAADIATDPLSLLAKASPAAKTLLGEHLVEEAGKKSYQSGLKSADIVTKRFGKGEKALSETLFKHGVTGGAESIADQSAELASQLAARQKDILAEAATKGATVDVENAVRPVLNDARKIQSGTNLSTIKRGASKFEKEFGRLADETKVIPETVVHPEPIQGDLLRESEIAHPVQEKQTVFTLDEPIGARPTGADQQMYLPERTVSSKRIPENLELFPSEPLPGKPTGPRQQTLFSNAETSSRGLPTAVGEETITRGKIPGGQTEIFTPGELTQPLKPTVIPGRAAPSVVDASRLKSQTYNLLGAPAYDALAKDQVGGKLFKRAGNRLKIAVEQSVSRASPELGQELKEVNKDLGNILTSKKVLARESAKEVGRNALTSVDAALLLANPYAAASKKVGDILKGTAARTTLGLGMYKNAAPIATGLRRSAYDLIKEGTQNGK